jgi:hypothetical protein
MSQYTRPKPFSLAWKPQSNASQTSGSPRLFFSRHWRACRAMTGRATKFYVYFFLRSGWQVQFLEPDLKTSPSEEVHICLSRED